MSELRIRGPLARLDDVQLATLTGRGNAAAFEILHARHCASLLAFCRHLLGSREDGEDALQLTFLRAYRALCKAPPPASVRAWLFAIARNRCRTMLAARRDAVVPVALPGSGGGDLAEDVERGADLRQLVADVAGLPDDQRAALVLSELGDLRHDEIAARIGCAPAKVKALVFQAREALIADRDARLIPCEQIRGVLETASANSLRRSSIRRHLRHCSRCRDHVPAVSAPPRALPCVTPAKAGDMSRADVSSSGIITT
jgi:RNA polymerase sigma factor (sigma-70 family)